ncbi:hypothetical protein OS493_032900 [Desmophyllum pertusum]|uniref:BRISC and BRCA1-A complex member 2 n=1 Tax=Desmophyllum pertusum TaxID=174260 RepID=A0A9W9YJC3_9CNID|nr:hypothetical protein OS493_032900 [Desmophyllum pertusum]
MFQKRREYIAAFLGAFGSSILEYDTEGYMKLSLLFQVQGFRCIVHVELDKNFPQESALILPSVDLPREKQPTIRETRGRLSIQPEVDWDVMAERARVFLTEKIPAFKESSLNEHR